jgi:hypothetical protein
MIRVLRRRWPGLPTQRSMVPALEQKFAQLAEFSPATSIGHVQMPDSGTLQDLQATAWLQQG